MISDLAVIGVLENGLSKRDEGRAPQSLPPRPKSSARRTNEIGISAAEPLAGYNRARYPCGQTGLKSFFDIGGPAREGTCDHYCSALSSALSSGGLRPAPRPRMRRSCSGRSAPRWW